MEIPFVDLKTQYESLREEIHVALERVMSRADLILGEEVALFEQELAAYCGVKHVISCASGTDALHLAARACGIGPGDEIITVPNTYISTVFAASYVGAMPVLIDVDPATYVMDVNLLEAAITPRTRAIIPVHLFGHPAPMDAIMSIAERYGLFVIEDVAQAVGSEWKGKRSGSYGHIGCYSFYPSKNLGAYGDGGAVTTNDDELARKLRLLRNYGQETKYYHQIIGYNSRLDTLQAAILRVKLPKLPNWTNQRRSAAKRYSELLRNLRCKLPIEAAGAKHVYHCYVIEVQNRDVVLSYLRSHGVMAQVHYPMPVHLQECYRKLGWSKRHFPVTERAANHMISLPIYPEITPEQQEYVASILEDAIIYADSR